MPGRSTVDGSGTTEKSKRKSSPKQRTRSGSNNKRLQKKASHVDSNVGGASAQTISRERNEAWHSKWATMELDLMIDAVDDGLSAPNFSLPDKWETMELDMMDAVGDELSGPNFSLPDEPDRGFTPPGKAGTPQSSKAFTPPGHTGTPHGSKTFARGRSDDEHDDSTLKSRARAFNGREGSELHTNTPRLLENGKDGGNFKKGVRRRPMADLSDLASRSSSPSSSKSYPSRQSTPRKSKPSTPPSGANNRSASGSRSKAAPSTPKMPSRPQTLGMQLPVSPGSWVRVDGLVGRDDLNGVVGQVVEWVKDRSRWRIQGIGNSDTFCVRAENLVVLDGPPSPSTLHRHVPDVDGEFQQTVVEGDCANASTELMRSSPMHRQNSETYSHTSSSHPSPRTSASALDVVASATSPAANFDSDHRVSSPSASGASGGSEDPLLAPQDGKASPSAGVSSLASPTRSTQENRFACGPNAEFNCAGSPSGRHKTLDVQPEMQNSLEYEEPSVAMVLACDNGMAMGLRGAAQEREDVEMPLDSTIDVEKGGLQALDILPGAPMKAIRCFWRLWYVLVALCLLETVILGVAAGLDQYWSPCRERLKTCLSIHPNDCNGNSCVDGAPVWAPAWPAAVLVFTGFPLRAVLHSAAGAKNSRRPRCLLVALTASVFLAGVGAVALAHMWQAGIHYAARCPLERSSGRCGVHVCPLPCSRKSAFSPCTCGRLEQAEMARTLFLNKLPACHPYEWYSWQMELFEKLMLRYENFACILGPVECTAVAIGAMLIMLQLACCPILLYGSWGLHLALLVLFAPADPPTKPVEMLQSSTTSDARVDSKAEDTLQS